MESFKLKDPSISFAELNVESLDLIQYLSPSRSCGTHVSVTVVTPSENSTEILSTPFSIILFTILCAENNYYQYSTILNDKPMSVYDFSIRRQQ